MSKRGKHVYYLSRSLSLYIYVYVCVCHNLAPCGDFLVPKAGATSKLCIGIQTSRNTMQVVVSL